MISIRVHLSRGYKKINLLTPKYQNSKNIVRCYCNANNKENIDLNEFDVKLFKPRNRVASKDDIIDRLIELEKKSRSKNKKNNSKEESTPNLEETLIFESKDNGVLKAIYASFCAISFPVHIYFYTVISNPLLVIIPLCGSILWLWWLNHSARSTIKSIKLLKGHNEVLIKRFTLFGRTKDLTVPASSITSGINKRFTPKKSSFGNINRPLSEAAGLIDITHIDIHIGKNRRKRMVLDTNEAKTFLFPYFLSFTHKPAPNVKEKVLEALTE